MYLHCCPIKSCTTVQKVTQPVREERRDDGDAVGGGEPEGVDEEEELHEAVVGPGVHPTNDVREILRTFGLPPPFV